MFVKSEVRGILIVREDGIMPAVAYPKAIYRPQANLIAPDGGKLRIYYDTIESGLELVHHFCSQGHTLYDFDMEEIDKDFNPGEMAEIIKKLRNVPGWENPFK